MEGTISEIRAWGPNWAPRNWALCNGTLLAISSNQALFSLIGTIYWGGGRTKFGLPDLRGRVPVGSGRGPGLAEYTIGSRGGEERVTLTSTQMPPHSHSIGGNISLPVTGTVNMRSASDEGSSGDPTGKILSESSSLYSEASAADGNMNPLQHTLMASGGLQE